MKIRCAAYARYSSARQSPASIEDQLRKCREYANRQGWELLEANTYSDEAISGSGADRPGLVRLLQAATRDPRPFDVILADDTSRLYRNLGDALKAFERLHFQGVRVVTVSQGIDSNDEQAEILMTFNGLKDSQYLKALARNTHRDLEGRAKQGLHTGGRCFGFESVAEPSVIGAEGKPAVRLQIKESEAAVVQRIFEMYAGGLRCGR